MGSRFIRYIVDSVLEVIYSGSELCIICNSQVDEEKFICDYCKNKIRFYNEEFTIKKDNIELQCFSAVYYSGVIVELIRNLKYYSGFESGKVLAGFLLKLINIKNIDFDLLAFVPMHKKAFRKRGYNQSRYLALLIGEELNKPVLDCLKKLSISKDQIGLDGEERWLNQSDSFKAKNERYIKNKSILLVDDVLTTGATTFFCAQELLNAGAGKVCILTVAKSKL